MFDYYISEKTDSKDPKNKFFYDDWVIVDEPVYAIPPEKVKEIIDEFWKERELIFKIN
jgi:hypothetical protein